MTEDELRRAMLKSVEPKKRATARDLCRRLDRRILGILTDGREYTAGS